MLGRWAKEGWESETEMKVGVTVPTPVFAIISYNEEDVMLFCAKDFLPRIGSNLRWQHSIQASMTLEEENAPARSVITFLAGKGDPGSTVEPAFSRTPLNDATLRRSHIVEDTFTPVKLSDPKTPSSLVEHVFFDNENRRSTVRHSISDKKNPSSTVEHLTYRRAASSAAVNVAKGHFSTAHKAGQQVHIRAAVGQFNAQQRGGPNQPKSVPEESPNPSQVKADFRWTAHAPTLDGSNAANIKGDTPRKRLPGKEILSSTAQHPFHHITPLNDATPDWFPASSVKEVSAIYAFHLRKCGDLKALQKGKHIHDLIRKAGHHGDVYVGNLLVQMYGKCGALEDARSVFAEMHGRNVFSWCLMIGAYIQEGKSNETFQLFQQMQLEGVIPDKVTCISLLSVCVNQKGFLIGKRIHASMVDFGFELDVVVGTALVNMYGKCGSVDYAREIFDSMPERNVVSWNAMIAVCVVNENGIEALKLYEQMLEEGLAPNNITFISGLDACTCLGALSEGKQMHARIVFNEFKSDIVVGNALVNMYGKCGDVRDAQNVFDKMQRHNVSSWNTIIAAHGQHGKGERVLQLFEKMHVNGVIPDKITYFSVLSACSHAALVEEGCHYFIAMREDNGVAPTVEHYNCMIDLLGRAGLLDDGEELIRGMPMPPDVKSWMALLGACRMHLDMNRAEWITERLIGLDSENPTPYVMLSNIYTAAGRPDDVALIRQRMKDKGFDISAE